MSKKQKIDFAGILTCDGAGKFLEEVRELMKKGMTVNDYEQAERMTDDPAFRMLAFQDGAAAVSDDFLHGYTQGIAAMSFCAGKEPMAEAIGVVAMNDLREIACKLWLAAAKEAIENKSKEKS